jgi:hypothetical protein
MEYILTKDDDLRDDMGLAIKIDKVKYLAFYCALVCSMSVGLIIGTYYFTSQLHTFVVSVACGLFGAVYGLTLGLLQGLPVLPEYVPEPRTSSANRTTSTSRNHTNLQREPETHQPPTRTKSRQPPPLTLLSHRSPSPSRASGGR